MPVKSIFIGIVASIEVLVVFAMRTHGSLYDRCANLQVFICYLSNIYSQIFIFHVNRNLKESGSTGLNLLTQWMEEILRQLVDGKHTIII